MATNHGAPADTRTWSTVPTKSVLAGGVNFAYRELGPTGGVPVVFLHHFAAVLDDWDPRIIDGIAAHHHVITFDNRGVGATDSKVPADLEQMGRDAATFIRALGHDSVDLLGFSLGGGVAQMVALQNPTLVRRMVLAGTGPRGGGGIDQMRRIVGLAYLKAALARKDARHFLFFPRTTEGKRSADAYFARLAERAVDRDTRISMQARLAQLKAIMGGGKAAPDDLSQITAPVFVANGDNDLMVASEHSADLARRLPNSQLTIYPSSGHGGIFQYHREFVPEVLAFLGEEPHTAAASSSDQQWRSVVKAFAFAAYKRPLQETTVREPIVGDHDVLVEIQAAGLNQLDEKIRTGEFKQLLHYPTPLTLGHDLAGTVIGVGARVRQFSVGDEVYARPRDGRIGTFAERIAVHEDDLALRPTSISMVDAASLPLVALTAWQALVDRANVQPGQKVLIHAGAGGVGSIAIQLAKHLGASVATTASGRNADFVRELGADVVVDYRTEDFADVLDGYDVVVDSLGGDNLERSLRVLRPGGKAIGIAGPPDPTFARTAGVNPIVRLAITALSRKIRRQAAKAGVSYEFLFMRASGEQLRRIAELVDHGAIRPIVGRTYPFHETPEALTALASGGIRGKAVITLPTA